MGNLHHGVVASLTMKIAYQGEPGALAKRRRGLSAPTPRCSRKAFEEVFERVEQGPAQYGVLPIENSIGGSIHRNYDLLMENHPPIGEVEVPVVHHRWRCRARRSPPSCLFAPAGSRSERFLRTLMASRSSRPTTRRAARRWCRTASSPTRPRSQFAGRRPRPDAAGQLDSGLQRQHHAVHRHRPASAPRHAARQDDDRVLAAERGGMSSRRSAPWRCAA